MKIWLLTHSEERKKETGTGSLVKEVLGQQCQIIEWSRVSPCQSILSLPLDETALVYLNQPEVAQANLNEESSIRHFIILDGTWQQARKMYNRSPYLHQFPHYQIPETHSVYKKRRNQKNNGLCTAETVIHLLQLRKHPKSTSLVEAFMNFNQ